MPNPVTQLSIVDAAGIVQDYYSLSIIEVKAMPHSKIYDLAQKAWDRPQLNDRYYKDQDPSKPLMSGLALPKAKDGKVYNRRFVRCTFHANCEHVQFVNCEFIQCEGHENLKNVEIVPPQCCTLSNMCEGHKAKMSPELLALIEAAPTEEEKQKVVNNYIGAAFAAGEWRYNAS